MTRRLGPLLFGVLALAVLASAGAVGGGTADERPQVTQPLTTPDDFDNTLFRIRVYANGSAKWTIQHARPLTNDTQIDRFRTFATEFNTQETTTYTAFQTRAEQLLRFGRNVTGRDMTATAFTRRAYVSELGQTRGVVEMSFIWTGFGTVEGERVRVGDIFEGGMYIAEGQRLELRRGPTLAFANVQPPPDSMAVNGSLAESESVTWVGELQFADQRPAAELAPRSAVGDGSDPPGNDGQSDGDGGSGIGSLPVFVTGFVVLLALVGGLAWYSGVLPVSRGGGETPAGAGERPPGGQAGPARSTPSTPTTAVPEEELLTDEDRVLRLLDDNGGRMKQVSIVEETDWSKSKVSMLLSDMEDDGQISKLRLGRENIISLSGQEPDAAGSPFEEEQ